MTVLDELFDRIGGLRDAGERTTVHYECRRCGLTLSKDDAWCSSCGSEEIAAILL
ncbi:hypothetical protein HTZ84_21790 [Haloterrigena sp. SYSU A558-1]|uniref:Zinc ribbon domain-containing protein n=1 Tax=Haloterrigena gelatinilytica TaxID=2741724 RepID=A0A8J8KIC3_9EURY|nr:hypothetical protein [Haloterrigena gelatinilytica]NUB93972.1 hypothetical protein [Haloterrigena gelatinilytica]NUC74899.1 hypothetical protein [Haloterrigena gelatinilytica]